MPEIWPARKAAACSIGNDQPPDQRQSAKVRTGRAGVDDPAVCAILSGMTKLLEQALREVRQLPEAEQDAAAGALLDYLKHMRDVSLTDAQVVEVRRRMADPNRELVSHAEARARIEGLGS
jgi:hypothetical protein